MRNARKVLLFVLTSILTVAMVPAAPLVVGAAPSIYYVDDDGDNGNSGTLTSPWRTIEWAIAASSSGDTIRVLPGTYSADLEQDFPIKLPPGVTLESVEGYSKTHIQGSAGTFRVIDIENATANTIVRGFKISDGGEANGSAIGVYNDSTFIQDWPLIEECFFDQNDAKTKYGGAIACEGTFITGSANPLIRSNFFQMNESERGGAVYCGPYSNPRIRENSFFANEASDEGGAVYVDSNHSDAVITGNTFVANYAWGMGGAALYLGSANHDFTLVEDNVFQSNYTSGDGGAIHISSFMDTTLKRNIFAQNIADGHGGALYVFGNPAQAPVIKSENNLYVKNQADDGGVIHLSDAVTTLTNDTICDNTAGSGNLAGVWRDFFTSGSLTLVNCILSGHADNKDVAHSTITSSMSENSLLVAYGNTVGANVIEGSADFFDSTNLDYRLKVGSRGIDEGSNAAAPAVDYFGATRPQDGDGDGTAVADMGYWERPDLEVGRIAGADRYATAAGLALSAFDTADAVVLASGEDFPDALSAAGLCGALEGPLLLTKATSLPSATAKALKELAPDTIYLVGGTAAISKDVADALDGLGYDVERIAGTDRYATSAEVARTAAEVEGGSFEHWAFFARGDEFPDALAAAPIAYRVRRPILLVRPTVLPGAIKSVLGDLDISSGTALGGTVAVSTPVKTQIDAILVANGGLASDRWAGANRYETAVAIAEKASTFGRNDWSYLGIATGTNFPDALAGGVTAGEQGGVVVLTKPTSLPSQTAGALKEHGDVVAQCRIFGGKVAVIAPVEAAIQSALGW